MTQVSQIDPPADIRALSTLPAIDYADSFTVTGGPAGEYSPEQWAHAALSQAPRPVRPRVSPSHQRIVASLLAHGARRLDQEALTAARN